MKNFNLFLPKLTGLGLLMIGLYLAILPFGINLAQATDTNYNFPLYVKNIQSEEVTIGTTRLLGPNEFYGLQCDQISNLENQLIRHEQSFDLLNLKPEHSYTCRFYIYYSPNGGEVQGISQEITFRTLPPLADHSVEHIWLDVTTGYHQIKVEWQLEDPINVDGVVITLSTQKYLFTEHVPAETTYLRVRHFTRLNGSYTFYDLKANTTYWIGVYPYYDDGDEKRIVDSYVKQYLTDPSFIHSDFELFLDRSDSESALISTDRPLRSIEYYSLVCSSIFGQIETAPSKDERIEIGDLSPTTTYTCRMYIYHSISGQTTFGESNSLRFQTDSWGDHLGTATTPEELTGHLYFNQIANAYQIKLTWQNKVALDGFNVFRYKNGGSMIKITHTHDLYYLDKLGLESGNEYCYVVTGLTRSTESSYSRPVCILVEEMLPPSESAVVDFTEPVLTNFQNVINPFLDVNINQLSGQAAVALFYRGIISGFPDGEFKGFKLVNRAEAAKILILTRFGEPADNTNLSPFIDVFTADWYRPYVIFAYQQKIIQGYPGRYFKPENPVTTAEFLKMMAKIFELPLNLPHQFSDVSASDWFAPYAGLAVHYELFPWRGNTLNPNSPLSRQDVVLAIYQYLKLRPE